MTFAFRDFPQQEIIALFEEAPGGGDEWDIDAPRNRPAKDPAAWLPNVLFHSHLDYMEVAFSGAITINHSSVGNGSNIPLADNASKNVNFGWGLGATTRLIHTHSLGYKPFCILGYDGNALWPGLPVQTASGNGGRFVTPYVTETQLRIAEWSASASGLSSVSRTYQYLILRRGPTPSGNQLRNFDPETGVYAMARNRFRSDRRYLQIVAGGSPLGLSTGRTIDLANGAMRAWRPDGTRFEPVPSSYRLGLVRYGQSPIYGPSMAYDGSYAFPGAIQVQAP